MSDPQNFNQAPASPASQNNQAPATTPSNGQVISINGTQWVYYSLPSTYPITYISTDYDATVPEIKDGAAKKEEGCACKKCKEFNQFAEPNQQDGTFICYGCRTGW